VTPDSGGTPGVSSAPMRPGRPRSHGGSGMTHSMKLRVYYEDTDAAGIVYYANYLKFAERGRTEMMRALGFAHSRIDAETGTIFTVRRLAADYRGPARLDDALTVDTRVLEIGGATVLLDQQIRRDGAVLVALELLVACIGRDGRPRRVPPGLRAALAAPSRSSTPSTV
jgi:acyl-CoA thioester hydrolase